MTSSFSTVGRSMRDNSSLGSQLAISFNPIQIFETRMGQVYPDEFVARNETSGR